ncbi:MAG: hypothetical protein HY070_07020 [Chloroflexi bacterium]|nr:hypothetical protein [Chloroflexota bacterium]MBI3742441.1 hypothetical protein [Chloroflexota bacterium]
MKLENFKRAIVPQRKITAYLLSPTHRDGKSKQAFFTRFGFSFDEWKDLAAALLKHAADNEVTRVEQSPFGVRYVIDGIINTPDGRNPRIRSIWFIGEREETPRFATAYPLKEK